MLHLPSLLWIGIALVTRAYHECTSEEGKGNSVLLIHFIHSKRHSNNTEQASESTCIKAFYRRLGSSLQ